MIYRDLALDLPTSVVITGIDSIKILDQAFEAISTLHPMSEPNSSLYWRGREREEAEHVQKLVPGS